MNDEALRRQVADLLSSGHAHATFERAVAAMPLELVDDRPRGFLHSAWDLLEHLRIAQWDILGFSRDPEHQSPEWPGGYWPEEGSTPGDGEWRTSVDLFLADRRAMADLVLDASRDLGEPFPWGDGQTLLREALLLADHNAYHVGQLVELRRVLGCWPPSA
ncbi:MAG: DinB family protein [Thermoanaerobaculia bacterium]